MKDSVSLTKWKLIESLHDISELEIFTQDATESNIPTLLNNVIYYISEAEALEEATAKQIADLQIRKDRFKDRANQLRELVKVVFDRFDIQKLETPSGTCNKVTRKASKLSITDEGDLIMNHSWLYTPQPSKLDKTALKKLLQEGTKIDGVELIDSTSIQIRK